MFNAEEVKSIQERRKSFVERYLSQLEQKVGRTADELRGQGLYCTDFPSEGVQIKFEDGSLVQFRYAFAIEVPAGSGARRVAVFTEHCGYHEFFLYSEDEIGPIPRPADA